MIKIINLSKSYELNKTKIRALQNINISIEEGKIFGLIGLSGAGKTTLLRSIASLEKIDSGSILINGQDINTLTGKNKRLFKRNIGVVFQGFTLLKQQTVFKNIAYPLEIDNINKNDISKKVEEMLDLVGLRDKANVYPSQLSGGQVQRVAIARALVSNPKVLLLDEITSALDPLTTIQILSLLKKINQEFNVTMLIITHDMKVVKSICDDVAIIYEGQIIENGKKEDVINNPQSEIGKMFLRDGGDIND